MTNDEEKKFLLKIARDAINTYSQKKETEYPDCPHEKLKEKRGTFVTITLDGQLRGCIGCLEPKNPLYKDVISNAVSAAFGDPRFHPLTREEITKIKIEISVLSELEEVKYRDEKDLLEKVTNEDGIVLEKDGLGSTFLPQVWKQIPDKKTFLSHLSQKAGLPEDGWKKAKIWKYSVEKFGE